MAPEDGHGLDDSPRRDTKYQSQLWTKDDKGRLRPPDLQSEYLEWLLVDQLERKPKTQREWAEAHGVSETTVKHWKRDPRFRSEWERRARAKNISTERIQNVVDALYRSAQAGDINAAKLYLAHVERYLPPPQVSTEDELREMTDDELEDELRRELEDG